MFDVALFITALISIALIVLGAGVYARNTQNFLNRIFFVFALCAAIWLLLNYAANSPSIQGAVSLWSNRVLLIMGDAMLLLFLAFILQLVGIGLRSWWFVMLSTASLLTWLICLTPLVIHDVSAKAGVVENNFGSLALVYFIPMFVAAIAAVAVLLNAHLRLQGQVRNQVDNIAKSMFVVIPVLVVGNAVMPLLGVYTYVNYAPLTLALLVATIGYVIVRHRLFNIRSLIVRSLAYAITLGSLSIIYALGVHYFSLFLDDFHNTLLSGAGNILLVILIITAYQPLKKLFDRLTNNLFYKDAYDPQALFNDLNRVHITNLDIKSLGVDSMEILVRYMKTEFCVLSLIDATHGMRHFTSGKTSPAAEELANIYDQLKAKQNTLVADNLDDTSADILGMMEKSKVAIVMRLREDASNKSVSGFLTIGQRNSGVAFTKSDLQTLETVVNELTLAIQNALHFEEIQNFNMTLQEKVDEATRKLRTTNEKLRKLDETKDEFISMASHQLRTPLTSVKGYLSMVLEGDAGELKPQQAELLKQSFLSSERMVNLIADLLNLSRLNTGKFVIDASPTDLREVVEGELAQLREVAKAKDIELKYDRPDSLTTLMLDENKIHQVVMNFIDNAIYYTPPGGKITVSVSETPSAVEYRVSDTGIGVPKALQHRLFTKFYRADNARRMRPDGTGLGIFMAKKIIIAQGGSIIFDSVEGKGSTFGFRFAKKALGTTAAPTPQGVTGIET